MNEKSRVHGKCPKIASFFSSHVHQQVVCAVHCALLLNIDRVCTLNNCATFLLAKKRCQSSIQQTTVASMQTIAPARFDIEKARSQLCHLCASLLEVAAVAKISTFIGRHMAVE